MRYLHKWEKLFKATSLLVSLFLLCGLSLLATAQPAFAGSGTTTVNAFGDGPIYEASPTYRGGGFGVYYQPISAKSGAAVRVALEFYPSIPANQHIIDATLRLYIDTIGEDPAGLQITAYRLTQGFNEVYLSWNKATSGISWATPGGDYDVSDAGSLVFPASQGAGFIDITVTDIVKEAYNISGALHNYVYLVVKYDDENDAHSHTISFRSQNWPTSGSRPKLVVNYTDVDIPTLDMDMYETNFYAMTPHVDYTIGEYPDIDVSIEYRANGAGNWTSYGTQNMVADGDVYIPTGDVLNENSYYEFRAVADYADGTIYSSSVYEYTWEEPDVTHFISSQAWSAYVSTPIILNDTIDVEVWVSTRLTGSGDPWDDSISQVSIIDDTLVFNVPVTSTETYDCIATTRFYDATYSFTYDIVTPIKVFTAPLLDEEVQILVTDINMSTNYLDNCIPTFRTNLLLGSATTCALHFEYRVPAGVWIATAPFAVTADGIYNYELPYALTWNTSYNLRAVVTHTLGSVTGPSTLFTTYPQAPQFTTQSAVGVATTTATLRGLLSMGGYDYAIPYFYYKETTAATWTQQIVATSTTSKPYTLALTNLKENTEYSYMFLGYASKGTLGSPNYQLVTVTGTTLTFTTTESTQGWVTRMLSFVGLDDAAGKMLLAILCIVILPVIVLLVFKGYLVTLITATVVTIFFIAINFIPLWLDLTLGMLLLMGFVVVIKGNGIGGNDA